MTNEEMRLEALRVALESFESGSEYTVIQPWSEVEERADRILHFLKFGKFGK